MVKIGGSLDVQEDDSNGDKNEGREEKAGGIEKEDGEGWRHDWQVLDYVQERREG